MTATHSCLARVTCGVGRPDRQLPPPTSPRTHSAHRLTPHMSDSPPDRPPAASGSKAKHRVRRPQSPRFRSRSTCTLPRPPRRGPSRRSEADTDRTPRCTQPRTTTACNRCRTKRGRCDGELSLRAQGPKESPGCAVVSRLLGRCPANAPIRHTGQKPICGPCQTSSAICEVRRRPPTAAVSL